MTHYLIIGTGAAGVSAAETIRKHDPKGQITLLGDEPDGYYSRPGLAYILTGEIPENQLLPFSNEEFARLRIECISALATKLDPAQQKVTLSNGKTLIYDRLLLATGAQARPAGVPGEFLPNGEPVPGVVQLDNFANTREIMRRARKAKAAVVVGGGITALELVEGLVAMGVKTHYFLRGDRYWANVLDEAESRIVEHRLQEEGVKIHFNTEIDSILSKQTGLFGKGELRVSGVKTKAGETISCDIVGVAVGVGARMELAQAAGIKTDKGIVVDDAMRTSHPNIFAAGDVAQVRDPVTGKPVMDVLWPTARDQGRVAGANMAGVPTLYQKEIPLNVTRLAGLTTTIIGSIGGKTPDADTVGIVRGDSETWREIPDAIAAQSEFDVNRIRLMVGEKTLLGAIVMGDQKLSQPIHQIVAQQVDITPIRAQLLAPNARIGEVIATYWEQILKA
ncbi:MAG TPA: FAD-dependent oxidoreductase [Anaerolineales bacterium]|nr:FAD-dependent oxidoreductase [Anaerolineales bacterium]